MRRLTVLAALLLVPSAAVGGQSSVVTDTTLRVAGLSPRPATDSLFRRARRLVAEGGGVTGRALVDSLLRAADPATPAYGDALYWHGALAPTAAEAERDYRRVIVEYPLAYYSEDALLAIAELEQARGDRAGALLHLQRFVKEHPASPGRGVAALGAARLAFEQRDTRLGCSMISVARGSASATDVELRNQIDYYGRQCTASAIAASAPPVSPAAATAAPIAPAAVTPAATVTAKVPPLRAQPTVSDTPVRRSSDPVSTMPAPVTPPPRRAPPAVMTPVGATTSQPVPMRPAPARSAPSTPTTSRPSAARAGSMYTIQLAAYDTRPPAEQLVRKLAARGVKARVSGTAKPFRVRLDFYRTRQEAANVVSGLKARGIIGFVAEEVPPPEIRSP
jgi:cell division septation protein DedD